VIAIGTAPASRGASSPLRFSVNGNTFTRAAGIELGLDNGLSHYSWTAGATALVSFSFGYSDDSYTSKSWSITRTRSGSTITELSGQNNTSGVTVYAIAGDVLRITASGDASLQYFDNVSVSAATPLISIARSNGGYSFDGSGTTARPFSRAASVEWINADGLGNYSWTANGAATVTVTLRSSDPNSDGYSSYVNKNGTTVGVGIYNNSGTRTFTVVAGDVITITADNAGFGVYHSNVSVSAA
jgi:hypothetical protein